MAVTVGQVARDLVCRIRTGIKFRWMTCRGKCCLVLLSQRRYPSDERSKLRGSVI